MKTNNFQIVVPFYNDEESFEAFIEILNKIEVDDNTFILLDNGSNTDEIKSIAQKKSGNNWKFVRTEQNLGFGGGIKYAAKFVEKDYVAWMPGNLKLNPSEVYKVLSEQNLNEKYVYVKCRRTNRPKIDYLKTRIFGIIASIYFGKKIFDAGGTPNLIHKDFFSIEKDFPKDFPPSFPIYPVKHGNLDSVRTYNHIQDAVEAYWLAVDNCDYGEVYNIGGDYTCTVGEALDMLISKSIQPKAFIKQLDKDRVRPTDITLQIPSSEKFRDKTGWKPTKGLEEICDDLLNYWRSVL